MSYNISTDFSFLDLITSHLISALNLRTRRLRLRVARIRVYFLSGLISRIRQRIVKIVGDIGLHRNRYGPFDTIRSCQFVIDHNKERVSIEIRRKGILALSIERRK